jgi:hypothetical protein
MNPREVRFGPGYASGIEGSIIFGYYSEWISYVI